VAQDNDSFAVDEGSIYAIMVNISENETSEQVRIKLPAEVAGQAKPMFEGRPSSLRIVGQELTGTIRKNEIHIYHIKLKD
jgi:hypothetical protein